MENITVTLSEEQFEQLTKKLTRELKKWMPRDAYTFQQAAHRLGIDPLRIRRDYILTGQFGFLR